MKESEGLYRSYRFLKRASVGVLIAIVATMIFGYMVLVRHVDARDAWEAAARELSGGMLRFGERVDHWAKAFQRRPTDYYRASNGLLIATNERLIFLGISPKSNLDAEDAPARIVQYEFPNDTLLTLDARPLYFGTARGVRVEYPGLPPAEFAAAPGQRDSLEQLVEGVNRRLTAQRREAARERRIRTAVAELIRKPIYYRIRRGDALASIADRFDTTPEELRRWNNLIGDRIRIGDQLIVKPPGERRPPPAAPASQQQRAPTPQR